MAQIPAEHYDTLDFAVRSLSMMIFDPRFSPIERAYMAKTRNRINQILLSPREGKTTDQIVKEHYAIR